MVEVATRQDIEVLESKIETLRQSGSGGDIWIMDLNELKRRTGFSQTIIEKHIKAGRLNPWKEGHDQRSKLRFYAKEVMELIPKKLRDKYGDPL